MERIQPLIFRLKHILERVFPRWLYEGLFVHKYAHFFATGVVGVGVNLLLTWGFTEFVFGVEKYLSAYIIGICANLLFNFIMHLRITFKTRSHVVQRMVGFVAYSLSMTIFQTWVVKTLVAIIGLQYYLFVIAGVILGFSFVTFLLFKFFLFRETTVEEESKKIIPQLLLVAMFSSVLIHITGLLEVLSGKGLDILVVGDGTGYLELAKNLWDGKGFGVFRPEGWFPEIFRTPGLPFILAPFMGVPHGTEMYLFFQTIAAGILLPLLVYLIGKKLFSERAGMIGAWLIALEPQMMFSSWSPLTEVPFLILVLTATFLLLELMNMRGCRFCMAAKLISSGLFFALAIYVRPGTSALVYLVLAGFVIAAFFRRDRPLVIKIILVCMITILALIPWHMRNLAISGSPSLSNVGWWNAYVNYVASIRVVEKGTDFSLERRNREIEGVQEFGLTSTRDLISPLLASELRDSALKEIWSHRATAIKMEALFIVSALTNDNYYNQLIRLGFIEKVPNRRSPSQILLQDGLEGVPRIMEEMRKQYFVPIISRLYQFMIVLLALIGLFRIPKKLAVLLFLLVALGVLSATVLGFHVEIRLRMPIMPILFLLAGQAVATGLPSMRFLRRMRNA